METVSNSRAASDTRHRVEYPNSRRRLVKVVGIGADGARIARKIESMGLHDVQVVVQDGSVTLAAAGVLRALDGADMIFMVASDGDDLGLAPLIKQKVGRSGVLVTGILIQREGSQRHSQTSLALLRAASDMLVIASDENYLVDMLVELGA